MASDVISLLGMPVISEDRKAGAAITPGHLIDISGLTDVVVHAGAGKTAAPRFALERDELGNEISVAYATNDQVKMGSFAPGMRVNALLASGANVVSGDFVESAGDGTLQKVVTDAATDDTQRRSTVGQVLETVTPTALTRVRVEVM